VVQAEYFSGFQKQFICNSFALYELEKDGVPTSLHVHATSGSKLCEISLQYSHCRPTAPTLPLCHTIQLMQHHVPHATPFNSCNTIQLMQHPLRRLTSPTLPLCGEINQSAHNSHCSGRHREAGSSASSVAHATEVCCAAEPAVFTDSTHRHPSSKHLLRGRCGWQVWCGLLSLK